MLTGALAASVTPLRSNGDEIDDDAFGPLVDFYVGARLDGILALGTAGEGILLSVTERRRVADLFLQPAVLERLRQESPNVVGLKVSDTPYERFERYLLPGFDIFVGPEALIHAGMIGGAIGAVSALASAFPAEVAAVVREPSEEGAARLGELRAFVERFPRQAALKHLLGLRGLPIREDVRAPLRSLTA